jgi:hypothetical protein
MEYSFRTPDGIRHRAASAAELQEAVRKGLVGPETPLTDPGGGRVRAGDVPELAAIFGAFASPPTPQRAPVGRAGPPASVWPNPGFDAVADGPESSSEEPPSPLAELEDLAWRRRAERGAEAPERDWGLIIPAIAVGTMIGMVVGLVKLMDARDPARELLNFDVAGTAVGSTRIEPDRVVAPGRVREERLWARMPPLPVRFGTPDSLKFDLFELLLNSGVSPGSLDMVVDEFYPTAMVANQRPRRVRLRVELPRVPEPDLAERIAQASLILSAYTVDDALIIESLVFDAERPEGRSEHSFDHEDLEGIQARAVDLALFLDKGEVPRDDHWNKATW